MLELLKSNVGKAAAKLDLPDATVAGVANFAGGAGASLATQVVSVPIDVISQRQMVAGTEGLSSAASSATSRAAAAAAGSSSTAAAGHPPSSSSSTPPQSRGSSTHLHSRSASVDAAAAARGSSGSGTSLRFTTSHIVCAILKEEGFRGLYRGFGSSVATFVPSSALWWGSYGMYQKLLWSALYGNPAQQQQQDASAGPGSSAAPARPTSTQQVVLVQSLASVMAGATSSVLTNPLDLIKTRIQVANKQLGQSATFRSVLGDILRQEGLAGLLRGEQPIPSRAAWPITCLS